MHLRRCQREHFKAFNNQRDLHCRSDVVFAPGVCSDAECATTIRIDLGKTTFHLVALSGSGKVLLRKKFTQKQLITFTANMQCSLIGMKACAGAHFLNRTLREQHPTSTVNPRAGIGWGSRAPKPEIVRFYPSA